MAKEEVLLTAEQMMKHQHRWEFIISSTHRYTEKIRLYKHDDYESDVPIFVVSNHVTNWDPLFLALSFPKNLLYFVTSDHLLKMGFWGKFLDYMVSPIGKKKGDSVAIDTVRNCLRRIRAGGSIALFAEGETSWNGVTGEIFPATGKLVKKSGITLVTYKIEGGYLFKPRWSEESRRGRVYGHPVNVYPPEVLKQMTPAQINETIMDDIYDDTWAWQAKHHRKYASLHSAEHLETALYMCPKCREISTLHSFREKLMCRRCGNEVTMTSTGEFEPMIPFRNIYEWDMWQRKELNKLCKRTTGELFSDKNAKLNVFRDDIKYEATTGRLSISKQELKIGLKTFAIEDIRDMAMVRNNQLAFCSRDMYYEIVAANETDIINLRKYLEVFHIFTNKGMLG